MYVTRPLSVYYKFAEAALTLPPDGPNSGYLVVTDEESEAASTCCWGLCKSDRVKSLPLPQNKILALQYTQPLGEAVTVYTDKAHFIPVLDQPLSSNRYYVVLADGKYKGQTCTCSREADMGACCFCCSRIRDIKPRVFDHRDVYQQVEIRQCRSGGFVAKSVAPDGFPPSFLRRKGWEIYASAPLSYQLGEAHGIDKSLRMSLPEFDFPISDKCSPSTVVGKWYCPFMFIKEEDGLKDQMDKSIFYEMCLERLWEEVYSCENYGSKGNTVVVNVTVQGESVMAYGVEATPADAGAVGGMMWFGLPVNSQGERKGVGLSTAIVDRMKWEALRGGWIDEKQRDVRVEKVEELRGKTEWRKFGCYVLVERFVLKRMDGSLVLHYGFRHTDVIQSKWA